MLSVLLIGKKYRTGPALVAAALVATDLFGTEVVVAERVVAGVLLDVLEVITGVGGVTPVRGLSAGVGGESISTCGAVVTVAGVVIDGGRAVAFDVAGGRMRETGDRFCGDGGGANRTDV